jgi:hypothetical protein
VRTVVLRHFDATLLFNPYKTINGERKLILGTFTGTFFDGHGLFDHLCKADPLKERSEEGKASIGSHPSFGKGYFDFVYLACCGRILLHTFAPPFTWDRLSGNN